MIERIIEFDRAAREREVEEGDLAKSVLENTLVKRLLAEAERNILERLRGDPAMKVETLEDIRRQFQEINAFAAVLRRYVETGAAAAQELAERDEAETDYEERHRA